MRFEFLQLHVLFKVNKSSLIHTPPSKDGDTQKTNIKMRAESVLLKSVSFTAANEYECNSFNSCDGFFLTQLQTM